MKLLSYLDLSFAPAGTCVAIVRLEGGMVAGIAYPGDVTSMFGRYGVCAPIFEECVHAPVHLAKPPRQGPRPAARKALPKDSSFKD